MFCKRQVTNNVFVNAFVHSPVLPRSKIGSHFNVNETISKGHWHAICHTFVTVTVTCRNDNNVIGEIVLTDTTVQDKLITCSLHCWGRTVHFIKEKNYDGMLCGKLCVRQVNWLSPIHLVDIFVEVWNTTNVSWLHLCHTQVNHRTVEFCGNFCNNVRLTDAGRAPQEHGTFCFECSQESFANLNRGDSQIVGNY